MFEALIEATKALSPWPFVDAGAITIITIASVMAALRGNRERKAARSVELPGWLMYGPIAEVIRDIRELREQGQETNTHLDNIAREQREQTQLLEDMRNTAVLGQQGPVRKR